MAWYYITYSCGHEGREQIYGPGKNRQWIADKKAEGLCPECYRKSLEEKREKMNRESSEWAKEQGLPELSGTPKQVAWAETIRKKALEGLNGVIERLEKGGVYANLEKHGDNDVDKLLAVIEYISAVTSAGWWIDNRMNLDGNEMTYSFVKFINDIYQKYLSEKEKPIVEAEKKAIEAEITVRPEKVKTETVAEIKVIGVDTIEIVFNERRDSFRFLMKETLKMQWTGNAWGRKISSINGTVEDRAAEAGHRILALGIPVRIADKTIREKAITGQYEPEHTRFILRRNDGLYKGWFAIHWDKTKEDFYSAARRISGSRWDKPFVVVPPEQFEQVLDFAERYNFRLTDKAKGVVEVAKKAKEEAIIINPLPVEKQKKIVAKTTPPVLDVPEEVTIDEELRDD